MTIRLVDSGWVREIADAVADDASELRIICPFIKVGALDRLLSHQPMAVQVITRFNLADFAEGVSDIAALRKLASADARVRGVRNLHAKLYLFGASRVIVTSANLTQAALNRNHEFGLVSQETGIIKTCRNCFDNLWARSGDDLSSELIEQWDQAVTHHRALGGRPTRPSGLGDFGANAGIASEPPVVLPPIVSEATQAFVKFFGQGSNRAPLSLMTIVEVERAGCHWGLSYPASKRPSGVRDGAVMFISRLTSPNDIRVFGRAIGLQHVPGRDDATPEDIELRPFKATWPRYVRVSSAEFVAGPMSNGVSLNELMDALGSDSFLPTQRNAQRGEGNTDPRRAYMQQAAVELTNEARGWLADRPQLAFDQRGTVPQDTLDKLDWPTLP